MIDHDRSTMIDHDRSCCVATRKNCPNPSPRAPKTAFAESTRVLFPLSGNNRAMSMHGYSWARKNTFSPCVSVVRKQPCSDDARSVPDKGKNVLPLCFPCPEIAVQCRCTVIPGQGKKRSRLAFPLSGNNRASTLYDYFRTTKNSFSPRLYVPATTLFSTCE